MNDQQSPSQGWTLLVNIAPILILLLWIALTAIGAFFVFRARRRGAVSKPEKRPRLVRWNTPFGNASFPSILVNYDGRTATVVVAPDGIDRYPKYLVEFGEVIALSCMDEACRPMTEPNAIAGGSESRGSSFELIGSGWLRDYAPCHDPENSGSLRHFLMHGGDNVVEIVSMSEPKITEITEPKTFAIETGV